MTQITNADKQARFRKKEQLKKDAERIFREWEISLHRWRQSRNPEDVRSILDKAVDLPANWTDEDYNHAAKQLGQHYLNLISSVDQIANDVDGNWESSSVEFRTTSDPAKFITDNNAAKDKARALASHLISALKLSNCSGEDQAAALMEAVRHVGLSLVSNREVRSSDATSICLASVGPQYDRPNWFAKRLAQTISKNIDQGLAQQVGKHLSESKHRD
jgi:hypothetical protein